MIAIALVFSTLAVGCAGLDDNATDPSHTLFIDPDQQVAEARAAQALYGGYWPDAPDPGDKAWDPETNLRDYPKLPALTAEQLTEAREAQRLTMHAHATGASVGMDVVTTETSAEGTRITIYDPAPGVTPQALAEELRAKGKLGVRLVEHEPGAVNILAPNDCRFGQAVTLVCPVAFWRNNGLADPLVQFNDHSGAAWPVGSAVVKWNQVAHIDSAYDFNFCPTRAGARCIDVYSGTYNTGWVGLTSLFFPTEIPEGPFRDNGNFIQLNDLYDPGSRNFTRNNVATHEVGHALGLGHNLWNGDVMWWVANRREDIGGENRTLLEGLYSVAR